MNDDEKQNTPPEETSEQEAGTVEELFELVIAVPKPGEEAAFALDPILGIKSVQGILDLCSENDIEPARTVITWIESTGKEDMYSEGYNCLCLSEVSLEDSEGRLTVAGIMHQVCEYKINFEKAHIGYRIYNNIRIVYIIEQETH